MPNEMRKVPCTAKSDDTCDCVECRSDVISHLTHLDDSARVACRRQSNPACACGRCCARAIVALSDMRAEARRLAQVVDRYAGKMTEVAHAEISGNIRRMLSNETTQPVKAVR